LVHCRSETASWGPVAARVGTASCAWRRRRSSGQGGRS
jgi:hypothetical protein